MGPQLRDMSPEERIKVTKLEAARRQCITALELYAKSGDPVSTHALAAAAYEILDGIYSKTDTPMVLMHIVRQLPKELRKEMIARIREAQNFFKHGDRDPDVTLDLDPRVTEFFLFEVSTKLRGRVEMPFLAMHFWTWFAMQYPGTYDPSLAPGNEQAQEIARGIEELRRDYPPERRREFFEDAANAPESLQRAAWPGPPRSP